MTALDLLTAASPGAISRLIPASASTIVGLLEASKFDNRPTWDNTPPFDNRPTWDNWNKK